MKYLLWVKVKDDKGSYYWYYFEYDDLETALFHYNCDEFPIKKLTIQLEGTK